MYSQRFGTVPREFKRGPTPKAVIIANPLAHFLLTKGRNPRLETTKPKRSFQSQTQIKPLFL
ncbi:Cfap53 [Phodopus roborovskii]|uniref:Cfap53 protein n=1 Tax=Phodopus roborovskii TaxID=109678 RepID=A0AAU9ZZZ4_PHORO|nr:Cfap53 [Phodopus roborovskii]